MGMTVIDSDNVKTGWMSRNQFGGINVYGGIFTTLIYSGWTSRGGRGELEKRMYVNFDTDGAIPANAVVTKVELYCHVSNLITSATNPANWVNSFRMGTFIGAALDSSDWNGGTAVLYQDWYSPASPVNGWLDLSNNAIAQYNNSGDTDICIRDESDYIGAGDTWAWVGKKTHFNLRVTWHIPQVVNVLES